VASPIRTWQSAVCATILAAIAAGLAASPAVADGPISGDLAPVGTLVPFTPEEQAIIDSKLATAALLAAQRTDADAPLGPDPCYGDERGNLICPPFYVILNTHYRHQKNWYFCGPASVQVVSNYSWGLTTGYKYTQQHISDTWTHTTSSSGTTVSRERIGLNGASVLPEGFIYSEYHLSGTTTEAGLDWYNKLRADIDQWEMPQAENVAPHNPGQTYFLSSWPNPVTAGHWVVANGWDGTWDGVLSHSDGTVSYEDGSDGYSGSDGRFWDPARSVFYTVWVHHRYIVW
jgi:hypothetical protein